MRLLPAVVHDPRLMMKVDGFSLFSHRPQYRQQGQRDGHREPQEQDLEYSQRLYKYCSTQASLGSRT